MLPAREKSPQDLIESALKASKADECIVIADEESSANLRWANNSVTTNGIISSRMLTVIAILRRPDGVAAGVISRNGVSGHMVEDVVRAAEAAARNSSPAEDAQQDLVEGRESGEWDEDPSETSFEIFARFAEGLGAAFSRARQEQRLLFGYAEHSVRSTYLGSSTGLRLRHVQPGGYVEVNAKPDDYSSSAWAGASVEDFADVNVGDLYDVLARRLDWAQRTIQIPAGRYETILPPSAVSDLMNYLYWYLGAQAAWEGRSVFSKAGGGTRVGERLSEVPATLWSDPSAPGLTSAPFVIARASSPAASVFDNGLSLQHTEWIADGVLQNLVQTRHTAQLTHLAVTPRIGNLSLVIADATKSLDDLIATTRRALLLTSLFYIREVDPQVLLLTGLTRDGVYLIENGEVVGAVNNFRFNESPVDLLKRILEAGISERALGRELLTEGRTTVPALRVADFNMSTVSQAI